MTNQEIEDRIYSSKLTDAQKIKWLEIFKMFSPPNDGEKPPEEWKVCDIGNSNQWEDIPK